MTVHRSILVVLCLAAGTAAGQSKLLSDPYQPLTAKERLRWFAGSTASSALMGNVISATWGSGFGSPKEYGGWGGWGKRYGMALSGASVGNAMEGSLSAIWGEDPHYFRVGGPFQKATLKRRAAHVIKSTFLARDRHGNTMPAYGRYVAIPGNNFLSNTWRVDSEADVQSALLRTLYGFLGRMGGNAFREFWPDVTDKLRNHGGKP